MEPRKLDRASAASCSPTANASSHPNLTICTDSGRAVEILRDGGRLGGWDLGVPWTWKQYSVHYDVLLPATDIADASPDHEDQIASTPYMTPVRSTMTHWLPPSSTCLSVRLSGDYAEVPSMTLCVGCRVNFSRFLYRAQITENGVHLHGTWLPNSSALLSHKALI